MHEKEYTSYVITTHLFPSGGHHWDHQYINDLGEGLVPIRRQAVAELMLTKFHNSRWRLYSAISERVM